MTTPQPSGPTVLILTGDCLDTLAGVADASVDSCVTDPPYGIEFMGKEWDKPHELWSDKTNGGLGLPRFAAQGPHQARAFQAWFEEVATELLRVLKPGGHLLSFGGTRMYHRMTCAIEDAGFEVRDVVTWHYASGFPKSLDVSKAIDKAAGATREVVGVREDFAARANRKRVGTSWADANVADGSFSNPDQVGQITAPATPAAQQWAGWGTALKPASEPIVVARKPLSGTVAATVLAHGTGALNIDGCRIGSTRPPTTGTGTSPAWRAAEGRTDHQERENDTDTAKGRWPSNVVFSHAEDCEELSPGTSVTMRAEADLPDIRGGRYNSATETIRREVSTYKDVAAVWDCVEGCPVAELDRQSGVSKSRAADRGIMGRHDAGSPETKRLKDDSAGVRGHDDTGGASRFYFVAKPAKRERVGAASCLRCDHAYGFSAPGPGSCPICGGLPGAVELHPTVKPLELMRYLVRLVTPPGGTVLEPFAGSGTTVEAAMLEGFSVIACEKTPEYLPLIHERVRRVKAGTSPGQPKPKPARKPKAAKTAAPLVLVEDVALPFAG